MPLAVVSTLRRKSASEAARLIGSAPAFIKDTNFINLLNQYDLNNKKNDALLSRQFDAFAGIPGLPAQVSAWLSS